MLVGHEYIPYLYLSTSPPWKRNLFRHTTPAMIILTNTPPRHFRGSIKTIYINQVDASILPNSPHRIPRHNPYTPRPIPISPQTPFPMRNPHPHPQFRPAAPDEDAVAFTTLETRQGVRTGKSTEQVHAIRKLATRQRTSRVAETVAGRLSPCCGFGRRACYPCLWR